MSLKYWETFYCKSSFAFAPSLYLKPTQLHSAVLNFLLKEPQTSLCNSWCSQAWWFTPAFPPGDIQLQGSVCLLGGAGSPCPPRQRSDPCIPSGPHWDRGERNLNLSLWRLKRAHEVAKNSGRREGQDGASGWEINKIMCWCVVEEWIYGLWHS